MRLYQYAPLIAVCFRVHQMDGLHQAFQSPALNGLSKLRL